MAHEQRKPRSGETRESVLFVAWPLLSWRNRRKSNEYALDMCDSCENGITKRLLYIEKERYTPTYTVLKSCKMRMRHE